MSEIKIGRIYKVREDALDINGAKDPLAGLGGGVVLEKIGGAESGLDVLVGFSDAREIERRFNAAGCPLTDRDREYFSGESWGFPEYPFAFEMESLYLVRNADQVVNEFRLAMKALEYAEKRDSRNSLVLTGVRLLDELKSLDRARYDELNEEIASDWIKNRGQK